MPFPGRGGASRGRDGKKRGDANIGKLMIAALLLIKEKTNLITRDGRSFSIVARVNTGQLPRSGKCNARPLIDRKRGQKTKKNKNLNLMPRLFYRGREAVHSQTKGLI